MRDPVLATDAHTYERGALLAWLGAGNAASPLTGAPLGGEATFVPNHTLRSMIRELAPQQ